MSGSVARRLREVLDAMPAARLFGIDVADASVGYALLTLQPRDDLTEHSGRIQGGVLGALVDFAGACACGTVVRPDEFVRTIDFTVKLHEPAMLSPLTAVGQLKSRSGRRVLTADVTVTSESTSRAIPIASGLVSTYVVGVAGNTGTHIEYQHPGKPSR